MSESGTPEATGEAVSEKLYGAKCIRCGCIDHHGSEGLEADPIPWLEQRGLECARCTFCQERALSRAIQGAGLFIFAPEVREAVEMFKRGDTSHPITQSLRAECLAIESGTPEAILSAEDFAYAVEHLTQSERAIASSIEGRVLRSHEALRRQRTEAWAALDGLRAENELLEDDLLRCMEVRNLALEEAALSIQTGGDGQDYLDRSRMIRGWLTAAYDRHAEGERAHQLTDGPEVR